MKLKLLMVIFILTGFIQAGPVSFLYKQVKDFVVTEKKVKESKEYKEQEVSSPVKTAIAGALVGAEIANAMNEEEKEDEK
jgi:hypothetical protein